MFYTARGMPAGSVFNQNMLCREYDGGFYEHWIV